MATLHQFPQGFLWGAATSSYQIEGAVHEDGRGESIWDVFAHTKGKVKHGDNGDVAADHYHRWQEDIGLMKQIGLQAYRFSIAWPRILPQGRGAVNEAGLAFYDRLVDELLKSGIQPVITLYHWDLPTALPGGWLERSIVNAFAEYTDVMTRRLGDRVKQWSTLNEPFCAAFLGYLLGEHAPGEKNPAHALRAAHHMLLAHGRGVEVIRANVPGAVVSQVVNPTVVYPASDSEADRFAARFHDGFLNRWLLDPLFGMGYPQDMMVDFKRLGAGVDFVQSGDMELISVPIDTLGLNYYSPVTVQADTKHPMVPGRERRILPQGAAVTDLGWEIQPRGLYELLTNLNNTYHPKAMFVAENGCDFRDGPGADGRVHDERRIAYLRGHISQVSRAVEAGVPVTGYFQWSLLDNFEWASGYGPRFGLIHVDYKTQARTIKDSALFYRDIIAANAVEE